MPDQIVIMQWTPNETHYVLPIQPLTEYTGRLMLAALLGGTTGASGAGDASAANQVAQINLETTIRDDIGSTSETAPVSDTATSGLNGRLQRLAQRFTTFMGLFPSSVGQKVSSDSLSVVLASDQPSFAVSISSEVEIKNDTGNPIPVDGSAVTQPVSAAALPLPSGASTEATLALIKAKTDNLDVALSTRTKPADAQHVIVDSSASIAVTGPLTDAQLRAAAVPVSAASLPLPSGAATEATSATRAAAATQTDGTQRTKITDGTTNAAVKAASTAPLATDPALVVALSPNSLALTISSEVEVKNDTGNPIPVSASSLPLPTGASTEAKQDAEAVLVGSVTETAPATDTASSGLNGRLQRIAQRLTSLIALLPSSLGQKTKANSLAITIASDQDKLGTLVADGDDATLGAKADSSASSDTGTFSLIALTKRLLEKITALNANNAIAAANVAATRGTATGSAATLAVARATRRGILIRNLDTTDTFYIDQATATTSTSYPVLPGDAILVPWVGLIQVIRSAGSPAWAALDFYD